MDLCDIIGLKVVAIKGAESKEKKEKYVEPAYILFDECPKGFCDTYETILRELL